MTKENFEKFELDNIICNSCGRTLDKSCTPYSHIRADGTATRCKTCDWIKRHGGIPIIDGYSEKQIIAVIDFILFKKSTYVNDLAEELNIGLKEAVLLLKELKIANKKCLVKTNCDCCGNEIENTMSVYLNNKNLYCDLKCYWKHKAQIAPHGKDNPDYNRVETRCTNCGKKIDVIPYNYNLKNKYGDNHNFCSRKCYWEYRSKYYVGEKAAGANRIFTDEQRERSRITLIKNLKSANRVNSKIQLLINDILSKNNIQYEREYVVKYYSIDNYLPDSNLMIEVMGDYWHTSPLKYNEKKYKINEMQRKGLQHDKQKYTYVKNHLNIEILYLWETDIEKNIEMCEQLILKYINAKGKLSNYHSFNWHMDSGILVENKDVIIPYQSMKASEYKHLLKQKAG